MAGQCQSGTCGHFLGADQALGAGSSLSSGETVALGALWEEWDSEEAVQRAIYCEAASVAKPREVTMPW